MLVSRIQDEQERRHSPKTVHSWEFLLADPVCHPAAAWVRICGRIFSRSEAARPSDWREWANAGHAFSKLGSNATGLARRRHVASADAFLVRNFRRCIIDFLLGWVRAVARCPRRVRERNPAGGPLGDVHVDRSHRPDLVWLRLGNSAARDGILIDFSLPTARWPALSQVQASDPGDLAFSVARFPHHVWSWPDQIARRPLLA